SISPGWENHLYYHQTCTQPYPLGQYRLVKTSEVNWLPWIGIDDLRTFVLADSLFQYVPAPFSIDVVGDGPAHNIAAVQVDDRRMVHKPFLHRDVGDVHPPDLVGPGNPKVSEQIGIDLLGLVPPGGMPARHDRLQSHATVI